MRIWIAAIGTRPRKSFEDLAQMYLERIGPLLSGGKSGVEAPLFRTEEAFREAVERERARTAPGLVLLDEQGRQMGSEAFAGWFGRERDGGRQLIIFAVGPADGWSAAQKPGGAMLLSLGPMTLPHELARVVLCEQVYRALTILKGHPYHRAGSR
ncbi:MAG TPA: 23S rRNA (pseudouridine(1915)-N(3))-methyltransferase RlmH [Acidobacteriaceae bacterium]|nr:23S rRNA (pseudouridine(1915)-N(3))-methyltransferase RlmH [Acidobacteriaceae bacterium]